MTRLARVGVRVADARLVLIPPRDPPPLTPLPPATIMSGELRLVPASAQPSASMKDTAGTLGLHDTMRFGLRSLAAETNGRDPLQMRLEKASFIFGISSDRANDQCSGKRRRMHSSSTCSAACTACMPRSGS